MAQATSLSQSQAEYVVRCLNVFLAPGQVCEIRALGVGDSRAVSTISDDVQTLAAKAVEFDRQGARGVYFTPNPLRPDLVGTHVSARKGDVVSRRWLLIDSDPVRAEGHATDASTEAEKEQAWRVLDACRGTLDGAGLSGAIVGDSGNGWHLCYPVDLPNDDASQELVKAVLLGLGKVCNTEFAQVDRTTHDAPRIWKLYGTRSRKGTETADRPHRIAYLTEASPWSENTASANTGLLRRLLEMWTYIEDTRKGRPAGDVVSRAKAYIAKEPPAISGQRGHDRTFHVACVLVKGFALSIEQALEAIRGWNQTCQPPWSEHELRHKLADAAKKPGPVGSLIGGVAGQEKNGHADASSGQAAHEQKPDTSSPFPEPIPASRLQAAETAPWLWHGFIGRGGITLLSALWKSGKTTLLASMLKAMSSGGTFCDHDISAGRILFVTEESEPRWADRRDRLGLLDNVEFIIRPFMGKPRWETWLEFLDYAVQLTQRNSYDLVVFDPLANLWPVKDENDASQVTSALMPLHQVANKTSILLVHHNRKGDGQEATATRGSGALTAFVDTIIELRRYSPEDQTNRQRVLTGYGRDDETVQEIVVELGENGEYRTQGTKREVKSREIGDVLFDLLPTEPPGKTFGDIMDCWPSGSKKPNRTKCFNALTAGLDAGLWFRLGEGVRGNPHTYWRNPT